MKEITALIPQVTAVIKQMSQAMGVAAEHLYAVLVRQMFAEGVAGFVTDSLLTVALVVSIVTLVRWGLWLYGNDSRRGSDFHDFGYPLLASIGGGVLVVLLVCVVSSIETSVLKMVNPEYYAIERVIDKVNPKK